jgi:plastocyanin domain-containing protein
MGFKFGRSCGYLAGMTLLAAPSLAAAQTPSVSLVIRNHRFEPEQVAIPANQKVELHIKNADPTPEEFESTDLRREKVVPAGEEIVVYVGPLRPGRYEFFGDFNPNTARGHLVAQ